MDTTTKRILMSSAALALAACGSADQYGDNRAAPAASPAADLATLSNDLRLGTTGPEVSAVNEYLRQFGYFPNAELARDFPAWRPLVAEPPAAPDRFDEHTAEAVSKLQHNMGLPTTGVVDAATREILGQARCGVPDGIEQLDLSDKFAALQSKYNKVPVLYRLSGSVPADLDPIAVQTAVDHAFQAWKAQISDTISLGINFAPTNGTPDINIVFGTPPNGATAATNQPPSSGNIGSETITLRNATMFWSTSDAGMSNRYDVQSTLTHEIGHALGFGHSSMGAAVTMWSTGNTGSTTRRRPKLDDHVAVISKYGVFISTGCCFYDIAGGAEGSIWGVSRTPWGQGYHLFKFIPTSQGRGSWTPANFGAYRIAVDNLGRPWVRTVGASIYLHSSSDPASGTWDQKPWNAADIGAGHRNAGVGVFNSDVWIIETCGGLDCGILKWNEGIQNWVRDASGGAASRITVSDTGIPYVLTSDGHFYRRTSADPAVGGWVNIPGLSNDLAIGPGNYLWSIGGPVSGNLVSIEVRMDQAATGNGSFGGAGSPAESAWSEPGLRPATWSSFSNLAADRYGNPWFISASGDVMAMTSAPPN